MLVQLLTSVLGDSSCVQGESVPVEEPSQVIKDIHCHFTSDIHKREKHEPNGHRKYGFANHVVAHGGVLVVQAISPDVAVVGGFFRLWL